MNWKVLAQVALVVIIHTGFTQCRFPGLSLFGTCASIGYSTSCCPRGGNCQAADGFCSCGGDCHIYDDCCIDVACPRNARTCADVGIHQCCSDTSGLGSCDVELISTPYRCSCNVSCHLRGDCCPGFKDIGCIPSRLRCLTDLPVLPLHDVRVEISRAGEVYNITLHFQCKKGYSEAEQFTAVCMENDTWSPNPNSMDYNCSDINECLEESVCPEDSQCINTDGSYTCSCEEGYFYVNSGNLNMCIDVDECVYGTHTCDDSERADCINNEGSYTCVCKPGFVGNGESCQIIDGSTCSDVCDQFCIQQNGSPICACDNGYYLHSDGVSCLDINECLTMYYDCGDHAECNNTNGSFLCVCDRGFTSDGNNGCKDKDECITGENNCDENAECINTMGSFECMCRPSYFGDGTDCLQGIMPVINHRNARVKPNHELQYNIGTNFCLEDPTSYFQSVVICLLTREPQPPPEFRWTLALNNTLLYLNSEDNIMYHYGLSVYQDNDTLTLNGTVIDGLDDNLSLDITCVVSNTYGSDDESTSISLCGPTECQDGVTNTCTQDCTRNVITGVHECSCKTGYEFALGSESICEDVDECTRNTHNCSLVDRQICHNTPPGSFSCDCGPGYNGSNCEDIDECELDTFCPASSICTNTNGSFECVCVNGTRMDGTGNCTDIDECLEGVHDCLQHAVCNNIDGSYTCECVFGFEGNGVNCTLSRSVIIATSVAGLLLVGVILLLLTITGCIKIIVKIKSSIPKKKKEVHEMVVITNGAREIEDSISLSTSAMKTVALRGSLKEKLTLSFIIKSTNLKILDTIGQGEFGIVYKGYIAHKYTDEVVAIKTLKGFIDDTAVEELLRECDKMKDFHHLHVMTLIGVCLDGGPAPYLILPYMANGSLLSYIRKEQSNLVLMDGDDTNSNELPSQIYFTRKRLLDMCLQVAKGMEYLASEKFVHRDLAARNCMIDINMVIKVADFGLAVNIEDKDYYRLSTNMGVKLPVKWMAPESLANHVFSETSDVWSYGVTCWEIFTGGQAPYAGTKPSSILSLLQEGERLESPKNSACSDDVYSMMLWCWEMEPGKRPLFSALVGTLSQTLEEMAGYLHVGAFTDLDSSTRQAEQSVQQID